ncbi:MAG: excisionase family DNA-binding protein [bacterium]|nr:excisionase family DNA-binding protein [bacterium]
MSGSTAPSHVPLNEKIAWSYTEVCQVVGLGRSTVAKMVSTGAFPKPRVRGGRRLFVAEEVRRWLTKDDKGAA